MSYNMKKRLHLYSFLLLEKKEMKEICSELEPEISKRVNEMIPDELKSITSKERKENDKNKIHAPTQDIKKIYRKIASKIHPDLNPETSKGDKFSEAAQAYAENDIGKLLVIAAEENVNIDNLSEETITNFDKNIDDLKKEIDNIKQTTAWKWYLSTTEEEKDKIIQDIVMYLKEKNSE